MTFRYREITPEVRDYFSTVGYETVDEVGFGGESPEPRVKDAIRVMRDGIVGGEQRYRLFFIDGEDLREEDGVVMARTADEEPLPGWVYIGVGNELIAFASDVNGDDHLDVELHQYIEGMGPHSSSRLRVYYAGDGEGNFSLRER